MTRWPALAPYTVVSSCYIEPVPPPPPPPPPPNTVKFFIGPGMRGFYTQVTGNSAWGQVFIFSSGPTHPPTSQPFSSPYPSALFIPLPLGPIHVPTPTPSEKETLPSAQCPVTSPS